jgi:hypothetical protein
MTTSNRLRLYSYSLQTFSFSLGAFRNRPVQVSFKASIKSAFCSSSTFRENGTRKSIKNVQTLECYVERLFVLL